MLLTLAIAVLDCEPTKLRLYDHEINSVNAAEE